MTNIIIYKKITLRNVFWSLSDNFLQQIINFIVGIILARLLLPAEFGLIGIVVFFITISNTFIDSGLSSALINERETDKYYYNTVFWMNIIIGIIFYLILYFISPYVAVFFKLSELTNLLRLSSISLLLLSLSSIQRTIFVKNLNFRSITFISFVSVSVSAIVAIYMAYMGYGVLSLVVRSVLGQLISTLMFWYMSTWRPSFIFNIGVLKKMYSYGIGLFLTDFLNNIHNNLYYVVIGKFFSPSILGFYTRANTFKDLASSNISNAIKRVSFSSLSRITDRKQQELSFSKYVIPTIYLTSVLMSILFLCAYPIIMILLGDKWLNSVGILRIIAISGVFLPIYSLNLNYLAVNKYISLYLKIEVFGKLLVIPIVIIGFYLGFTVMLYSILFHSFIIYLASVFALKHFKLLYKYQLRNVLFCIVTIIILYFAKMVWSNVLTFSNIYMSFFIDLFIILFCWMLLMKLYNKSLYRNVKYLLLNISD
ncbi:MAG: lipopolysaccharide biosynthesis protein [Paludibacter sp.]|nr:lipopolysaccharide biosynthesis protein [Paludibacter sp.]